jgi:hypothetical protein
MWESRFPYRGITLWPDNRGFWGNSLKKFPYRGIILLNSPAGKIERKTGNEAFMRLYRHPAVWHHNCCGFKLIANVNVKELRDLDR